MSVAVGQLLLDALAVSVGEQLEQEPAADPAA